MAEAKAKKGSGIGHFFNQYNTILIFIAFVIVSTIISSSFLTWGNITNLMKQNAALALYNGTTFDDSGIDAYEVDLK